MFKFIHAADIHLDSPLKGLEKYEGAPVKEIRGAARRAFSNLVDLAIDQQVAFVLIAGDLYDGDWPDMETGFFFVSQASRLAQEGIPLFVIAGNHDAESRISRSLRLPSNVTVFPATAPDTELLPDLNVAIHGQSFATQAVYDDLSESYPTAKLGYLNVGMLHTCASGREGHEPYAPCTIEGLKLKGYDYWALGHIHIRDVLCEEPFIAFSGNIQGRHIRETGPKGCFLVTVADDRSLTAEFRELDVMRWEVLDIEVGQSDCVEDLMGLVGNRIEQLCGEANGLPLALRIVLTGESGIHHELLAQKHQLTSDFFSLAIEVGAGKVWVEKVKIQTSEPMSGDGAPALSDGAIGELEQVFRQLKLEPSKLEDLGFDLADVIKKLPAGLRSVAPVDDPEWLDGVVAEAESSLLARLKSSEADA